MVEHKEYKRHQETCGHRPVICPGSACCGETMAFCEVEEHASTCVGISRGITSALRCSIYEEEMLYMGVKAWRTEMFNDVGGDTFFLQIQEEENIFSVDVVMLGSKEQCEGLAAEVTFTNPITRREFFKSTFSPRPITATNDTEDASLIIKQRTVAKGWNINRETKYYEFTVTAKVSRR